MMRILTAIILLALGAYVFKRDTTVLVLVPIERMFKKVGSAHTSAGLLAVGKLIAGKIALGCHKRRLPGHPQVKQVSLNPLAKHPKVKAKTEEEQLETRQLENALDKICRLESQPRVQPKCLCCQVQALQASRGMISWLIPGHSLLAIGFGDAGAEVIANNIKSGGDIDPMVPGHKVTAIFGFCDIRQFTDTTEVLQVWVAVARLKSVQ